MTNKEVFELGKILQFYTMDSNPVTGDSGVNTGIDNLIIFDGKVYSILTDESGVLGDPDGAPVLISDDPHKFMSDLFFMESDDLNLEKDLEEFRRESGDMIRRSDLDKFGWTRNDDW